MSSITTTTTTTPEEQEAQIEQASLDGNLPLLKYLVDGFLEPHQPLWWEVSEKAVSHVDVLKWIYQRDKQLSPDIWQSQYKFGSLESVRWLVENNFIYAYNSYALNYAISEGNIEMVVWLYQKVAETRMMPFENYLECNVIEILQYGQVTLLEQLIVCEIVLKNDLISTITHNTKYGTFTFHHDVCMEKRAQTTLWLIQHNISIRSSWMITIDDLNIWQDIYARNLVNNIDEETISDYYSATRKRQTTTSSSFEKSVIWLLDHGYKLSQCLLSNLAFDGDIEKLNWLYETCTARNIRFTLDAHLYASPVIAYTYSDTPNSKITIEKILEVMAWLYDHKCSLDDVDICRNIARTGNVTLLQWVFIRGAPWDQTASVLAAQYGHLELLRWAIEQGIPHLAWGERTVFYAMTHLNVFKYLIEEKHGSFQPTHSYCDEYPYTVTPSTETFLWALENRREYCIWKHLMYSTAFFYREEGMTHHQDWQTLQIALRNCLIEPLEIAEIVVRTREDVLHILQDCVCTRYHYVKSIPNRRWQMIATLTDVLNRMAIVYQLGFMKSGFSEKLLDDVAKNYQGTWRPFPPWDWQKIKQATDEVIRFNVQSIASRRCRLESFYEKMFYPYRLFQNSWQQKLN